MKLPLPQITTVPDYGGDNIRIAVSDGKWYVVRMLAMCQLAHPDARHILANEIDSAVQQWFASYEGVK